MKITLGSSVLLSAILGLAVLGTGCATSAPGQRESSARTRAQLQVEAANAAIRENNLPSAFQFLKVAQDADSSLPSIYHLRAIAYYKRGELPAALAEIRIGLDRVPDDVEMNNTYGKMLMDSGDYKNAEAPLLKAANDPAYADAYKAHSNLGILFYRQNKFAPAQKYLNQAVTEAPAQACIAHYYLGHIQLKQGRFSEATRSYDRATQNFCTNFADAHLALGIAYERNKQYDLARKKFLDIKINFPNTKIAEQAMDRLTYLP